MADGRHIGKYIFGYNSTMVCQICAKFRTKTQNSTAMTVEHQNFELKKFKMADGFVPERYGCRCSVAYRHDYRAITCCDISV